ncbi:hypothetical protein B9Z55_003370 [Caenorhabditis nigoni]|uniref:Uncharacterized protein n=1 Tax=Caenorhabditis nigoni TaxID=1611254 RepID=A0A2G5VPY8_9PELO|nr:hypothetical protein B9Z55_003370 [Caenorhabditis nigoni]
MSISQSILDYPPPYVEEEITKKPAVQVCGPPENPIFEPAEDVNATILTNLPDPKQGFSSFSIGSNIFDVIEQFFSNTQAPVCGSRIVILLKRYPNEADSSRLVSTIRYHHAVVHVITSATPFGGSQPKAMYSVASKTNGMGAIEYDESFGWENVGVGGLVWDFVVDYVDRLVVESLDRLVVNAVDRILTEGLPLVVEQMLQELTFNKIRGTHRQFSIQILEQAMVQPRHHQLEEVEEEEHYVPEFAVRGSVQRVRTASFTSESS